MAADREGRKINLSDRVRLTKGMAVEGCRNGVVTHINGEYILVNVPIRTKQQVCVERYGCEIEVIS